jgi:hypothetical protein
MRIEGLETFRPALGLEKKKKRRFVALGGYRWSAMSLSFTADIHSFAQHSLLQNTHLLEITHFILTQREIHYSTKGSCWLRQSFSYKN